MKKTATNDSAYKPKAGSDGKSLVIVESLAKAKTINKYLGYDFEVKASMGHVRDLPKGKLNVDIENGFKPTYEILPSKKRTVTSLKAAAKECRDLYLATDLDREGEAIAWHLAQILGVPDEKTYRVIFNAITESAIKQAFARPGRIDMDKVMAQRARQILDKIIGYQVSPLLWKKIASGLSAGRVQSVAVKIVVEREREIRNFKPEEYWLIPAVFTTDLNGNYTQEWLGLIEKRDGENKTATIEEQNHWLAEHNAFKAELHKIGDEKFKASNKEQAERIFALLKNAEFKVAGIETKESTSRPGPPFITSTLQQAAANRLGLSTKKTMIIAQQLYEGIDLGSMGTLGLITYMRTDSTHLSGEAVSEARSFINRRYGDRYVPEKPNVYAAKSSAQQAHEAIRPTDVDLTPEDIQPLVTTEQYKLYDLIWRRFIACQMSPARWDVTNLDIAGKSSAGTCLYKTTGRVLVFDGFTKVWQVPSTDQQLPPVKTGQKLGIVDIKPEQHFTKPPARYTEASLVKALEKEGIGRPSTYATIISTIQDRGYVEQKDKKFYATDLGEVVTDKLNEYFPKIMDIAFTRYMEEQLDKIEEQHLDWVHVLEEFYGPFKESLTTATTEMKHATSAYECPRCGEKLVYRFGKKGRFLSCSDYPKCKFSWPCDEEGKMVEQKVSEHKCPTCGKPLIYRFGKNGRFLGCSGYPRCEYTSPCDEEINPEGEVIVPEQNIYLRMPIDRVRTDAKYGVKLAQQAWRQMERDKTTPSDYQCPNCGKPMIHRTGRFGSFLGCSDYPSCKTVMRIDKEGNVLPPKPPPQPTGIKCYKCKDGLLVIRQSRKWPFLGCSKFPRCRTIVSIKQLEMLKKLQSEGRWPASTAEEAEVLLGRKKLGKTAKVKS